MAKDKPTPQKPPGKPAGKPPVKPPQIKIRPSQDIELGHPPGDCFTVLPDPKQGKGKK